MRLPTLFGVFTKISRSNSIKTGKNRENPGKPGKTRKKPEKTGKTGLNQFGFFQNEKNGFCRSIVTVDFCPLELVCLYAWVSSTLWRSLLAF